MNEGLAVYGWVADQRSTLPRITVLIARLFHFDYTERGVSYLLHRIGRSPQVPVHRAAECDEAAIDPWRAETRSQCFEDEAGRSLACQAPAWIPA